MSVTSPMESQSGISWSSKVGSRADTSSNESRSSSWVSRIRGPLAATSPVNSEVEGLQLVRPAPPIAHQQQLLSTSVDGVVLVAGEDLVRSEIRHNGATSVVDLPAAMFPFEVMRGSCFTLSMENERGYRLPKITERAPDLSLTADLLAEADRLMADF